MLRHIERCLLPACLSTGVAGGTPHPAPLLNPLAFLNSAGNPIAACMPARGPKQLPPTFVAHRDGYVLLRLRSRRNEMVHRLVCWLTKGPPTHQRMQCAHLCGRPNCLNPMHLMWVWPITNSRMARKHAEREKSGATDLTLDINPTDFPEQFDHSFKGLKGKRKRGRPKKKQAVMR